MAAIWKGALTFGLVNIPVQLHSAVRSGEKISFRLLHADDLAPVKYERVCSKDGEVVPWGDIVKGYEYAPDEYVVLGEADFKKANPEATKTIEIMDFVDAKSIDPVYFETPYYVEPIRKDSKGYALLREALERTGKVGIAQFVLRTRQYLGAVVPRGKVLVINILRFAQELRDAGKLDVPPENMKKLGISERELDMATKLVEGMTAEWDPDKYRDTYADDIHDVIEKKIRAGKTHVIEEPKEEEEEKPKSEVYDLTKLLERSLKGGGKKRDASETKSRAKRARTAAKRKAAPRKRRAASTRRHKKAA